MIGSDTVCKQKMHKHFVGTVILGLMSGCTVGPDYQRPEADIPQDWRVINERTAEVVNTAWWEDFGDTVLDEMVRTAIQENKDLRMAAYRVEEFAARAQVVRAGRVPQFRYAASASRVRLSENRPYILTPGTDRSNEEYEVSAGVSWELDIWGRVRRASDAALADLLSTEEAQQSVMLSLVASVATAYVQLLCLDEKLEISRNTLKSREQTLKLFETRFTGGAISELELAQARSAYEEAASAIPTFERRTALQENILSALLGRNPGAVLRGRQLGALSIPPVPDAVPSSILERRPDVRQAEQNLVAANARIGVAKASFFPAISLTGLFGYASTELSDLVQDTASFGTLGPDVLGNIFTGGRTSGEVRRREAVQKRLVIAYLRKVQTALREVDDALVSRQKYGEQFEIERRRVAALADYADLARKRYDGGYTGYLEVLDAERRLYSAQIAFTDTECDIYVALIGIYKAMGGGWPVIEDIAATGERN